MREDESAGKRWVGDHKRRCSWCLGDPLYVRYHDTEWGVQLHDDSRQFEFLTLECFQAGLSWLTILRKRENFRKAFDNFDPVAVSSYDHKDIRRLMADSGIVRNRSKIVSAIGNASAFIRIQEEFGSFDSYIWTFVEGKQKRNGWRKPSDVPSFSTEARALSSDLYGRGFSFVGPTVCYAHMQATGMVNDHLKSCFRYRECQ
jgi:DNA-3-methyladenine glycosylase I